jgi:hypothetical protein
MRINPAPFLLIPGIALAGYSVAGWGGAWKALLGWTAFVTVATLVVVLQRAMRRASSRPGTR